MWLLKKLSLREEQDISLSIMHSKACFHLLTTVWMLHLHQHSDVGEFKIGTVTVVHILIDGSQV